MGWTLINRKRTSSFLFALLTATLLAFTVNRSFAQYVPPPGLGGNGYYNLDTNGFITPDTFLSMDNGILIVDVGVGSNQGGAFGLFTSTTNVLDPYDTLLYYEPLVTKDIPKYIASRLFVRVDGGINGGSRGFDYEFGTDNSANAGVWLQVPTLVGNHIVARWETFAHAPIGNTGGGGGVGGGGGTGGTGSTAPIDPKIEIDLVVSFIHNQARFQFTIVNNDTGKPHTVGLVFHQSQAFDPEFLPTVKFPNHAVSPLSAPLRIPNKPYIRTETLLTGNDIPAYWEIERPVLTPPIGTQSSVGLAHSVRGTLRPTATSGSEPTVPSRFALGQDITLEGILPPPVASGAAGTTAKLSQPGPSGRYFDTIWGFTPNPKIRFDTLGSPLGSIALFYDEQPVSPGQNVNVVAYVGQSDCDIDIGTPIGLVVTSPTALPFSASVKSQPFAITASVTNLLDLQAGGGIPISPVGVSLDLPAGLVLAPGETLNTKNIASIAPGSEGTVSWNVVANGTKTGLLQFTVTAAAGIGPGKTVQRTVYVADVPAVDLKGNASSKGLYQMISVPLNVNGALITSVLFPNQDPNIVTPDVVRYDAPTGKYVIATTFSLGQSYWIRSRITADQHVVLDPTIYQPLTNQVQPSAAAYTVTYSKGWNQIGNPYLYPINFSEVQIFDPTTLTIISVSDASSPTNQVVLPAVFYYDTSDRNPANWHYVMEPSIGFQMQPYMGYWIYIRRQNMQFLYPGVDIPGVSVSKAAMLGVGFNKRLKATAPEVLGRNTSNNWRLKISARSDNGYDPDNFIGVAPNATDGNDGYKYAKPPIMNNNLSFAIVHNDWEKGGRYAHDLRSAAAAPKTWEMAVKSGKPNESVTLTWSTIAHDVPRNYQLTLIDPATNQSINMRNTLSHVVTTGADGSYTVQIVAQPKTHQNLLSINTFEVLNNATSTRGTLNANINFTLTGEADTQIVVRNGRGQIVRTLTPTTKAVSAGITTGTALWDLKSQQGATVAAGQYNVELRVKSTDGHSARRTTSFLITR